MRRNLLTVLTFALVIANLVMNVILTMTIVPQTKKANELISKVCEAIELDIAASDSDESAVPLDQIQNYDLVTSDNKLTINLKKGEDGEQHFALLSVSLSLNMQSSVYGTYGANMDSYASKMKSVLTAVVSSHTLDELQSDQLGVQNEVKDKLNAMFGASDYIVSVDFVAQYQ